MNRFDPHTCSHHRFREMQAAAVRPIYLRGSKEHETKSVVHTYPHALVRVRTQDWACCSTTLLAIQSLRFGNPQKIIRSTLSFVISSRSLQHNALSHSVTPIRQPSKDNTQYVVICHFKSLIAVLRSSCHTGASSATFYELLIDNKLGLIINKHCIAFVTFASNFVFLL